MGNVDGIPTRKYHSLLTVPHPFNAGRLTLVTQVEAFLRVENQSYPLSSFCYAPGVVHPHGYLRISSFTAEPWATWRFVIDQEQGIYITHQVLVSRETGATILSWSLSNPVHKAILRVRPLLAGRDYHALRRECACDTASNETGKTVQWQPFHDAPAVSARSNGGYHHDPSWYKNFMYEEENSRGYDHIEDLYSPGTFTFDMDRDAVMAFCTTDSAAPILTKKGKLHEMVVKIYADEKALRSSSNGRLSRACRDYLIARGDVKP